MRAIGYRFITQEEFNQEPVAPLEWYPSHPDNFYFVRNSENMRASINKNSNWGPENVSPLNLCFIEDKNPLFSTFVDPHAPFSTIAHSSFAYFQPKAYEQLRMPLDTYFPVYPGQTLVDISNGEWCMKLDSTGKARTISMNRGKRTEWDNVIGLGQKLRPTPRQFVM